MVHVFFLERHELSSNKSKTEIMTRYPCLGRYVVSLLYMYVILAVIRERLEVHQLTLNHKFDFIVSGPDNYRSDL